MVNICISQLQYLPEVRLVGNRRRDFICAYISVYFSLLRQWIVAKGLK